MVEGLLRDALDAHRAGDWDVALEKLEGALKLVGTEGDAGQAAEIIRRIGVVHRERGDLELALEACETSLVVAEANGLLQHTAAAYMVLASIQQLRGSLSSAEEDYGRASAIAEEIGDERIAAMAEQNLGILANIRGDVAVALASYGSALERHVRLGDDSTAAGALINMAMAHMDLEEWRAAESHFTEAHELASRAGDTVLVGLVELNRAELFLKRQQYEDARQSCDLAVELFGRLGSKSRIGEAYKFYGMLYREIGNSEQAGLHLALSLGMAEVSENRLLQAETQLEWALVHLDCGRQAEGIKRLNRAYKIFMDLQARRELLEIDRKLNRLRETYVPAIARWADASDSMRSDCVAEYTVRLGAAAGMAGWDMTWLRAGAIARDVGNRALPRDLLGKPGSLTQSERELVQSHTVLGDAMMSEMDFPDEIRPMVRSHHERWDGNGYPDRIGGNEIPLNARILRVADVFGALTSDKHHRVAYSGSDALHIMKREAGRSLDPELCGLFSEMVSADRSLTLV
ncbi:MAG TPA: HD domain-containing phosphohydrolase [Longimicrobiaceae bacterium]|nr:HD domain-containing phosphohydrolase [Longimicrobiaceae bacterium]